MANVIEISFDRASAAAAILTKLFSDESLAKLGVKVRVDVGGDSSTESVKVPRVDPDLLGARPRKAVAAKKGLTLQGKPRKRAAFKPIDLKHLAKAVRQPGFTAVAYAQQHDLVKGSVARAARLLRKGAKLPRTLPRAPKVNINMEHLRDAMTQPGFSSYKYAKKFGVSQTAISSRTRKIKAEEEKRSKMAQAREMLAPEA